MFDWLRRPRLPFTDYGYHVQKQMKDRYRALVQSQIFIKERVQVRGGDRRGQQGLPSGMFSAVARYMETSGILLLFNSWNQRNSFMLEYYCFGSSF